MSSVTESVDVAVPISTVYDQWTQFEDFPRFMEGVDEVRQLDDEMTHWRVRVAGVAREFDARITEQHPDERVAWSSVNGPKQSGVVTFHQLDADHTRVTAQMEMDPEGMTESVGDKAGLIKHRVKGDLDRFRTFIEHRNEATGSWRGDIPRPKP